MEPLQIPDVQQPHRRRAACNNLGRPALRFDRAAGVPIGVDHAALVAEAAFVGDAEIGREFAADLVALSQPELALRQPRANVAVRDILSGKRWHSARLQDQSLGEAPVVAALDPRACPVFMEP